MTDVFRTFSVIQNPFLPSGIITCPTTGIQRDMSRSLPTCLMSCCDPPYIRGRNFHHHHTPSVPQVENQRFLVLIMELLFQQTWRIFQRQPTIATPIQVNGLPIEPFLIEGSFQPGVKEFKQQGIFHIVGLYNRLMQKHTPPEKYFPFCKEDCTSKCFHSFQSKPTFTSSPVYSAIKRKFFWKEG